MKSLVIIPTYNEAVNIRILLDELLTLSSQVDVLVVDDSSPDGTGAVVENHPLHLQRVFLLQRQGKNGYASACKAGIQWLLARSYEIGLTMDADRSHDPQDVPKLLETLGNAELAVGSRYLDGVRVINWPARRLFLSMFAGAYTRLITGLPMSDPTSGFKAATRALLEKLPLSSFAADGYGFIIELHFHVWRNGARIREVPIVFTERHRGVSKMSRLIMFESACMVLRLGLKRCFC